MAWRYGGRTEQRKAAIKRKADALELAARGEQHWRGAMYLAGYAIECKIKAIAMERFDCSTLDDLRQKRGLAEDDVYAHGLEALMGHLLPEDTLRRLLASDSAPAFTGQVNRWSPQWRYDATNPTKVEASSFLGAVEVIWNWLGANV